MVERKVSVDVGDFQFCCGCAAGLMSLLGNVFSWDRSPGLAIYLTSSRLGRPFMFVLRLKVLVLIRPSSIFCVLALLIAMHGIVTDSLIHIPFLHSQLLTIVTARPVYGVSDERGPARGHRPINHVA